MQLVVITLFLCGWCSSIKVMSKCSAFQISKIKTLQQELSAQNVSPANSWFVVVQILAKCLIWMSCASHQQFGHSERTGPTCTPVNRIFMSHHAQLVLSSCCSQLSQWTQMNLDPLQTPGQLFKESVNKIFISFHPQSRGSYTMCLWLIKLPSQEPQILKHLKVRTLRECKMKDFQTKGTMCKIVNNKNTTRVLP